MYHVRDDINKTMASENAENVRVAVRCRPFIVKEKQDGCKCIIKMDGTHTTILNPGGFSGGQTKETSFTFDHSYFWDSDSLKVYEDLGQPLLEKALEGYNATIFAYGQTGAGKSYSMTGSDLAPGIIPLMNKHLFDHIQSASSSGRQFLVTVSYLEIYQEVVYDLLNPHGKDMKVRQHPALGIYVEGLAEIVVRSGSDIARLQDQGNKVRRMAATDMNEHSSRSHSVFIVHVKQRADNDTLGQGLTAKINLVDLAGSERQNMAGTDGQTLREGAYINKSLSALGNVINALADQRKKTTHIPYRDSKLTRILQESLGGNCLTVMVAMLSPADYNYAESLSTLQFANRAKNIKNTTRKNEDENTRVIRELREEIARLRDQMKAGQFSMGQAPSANLEQAERMEKMIQDLEMAKKETWEEKERLSTMYEDERTKNLASKGILDMVMDTLKKGHQEMHQRLADLQNERDKLASEYREKKRLTDKLKEELQTKINEYTKFAEQGGRDEQESKAKVAIIHSIKDQLKQENEAAKTLRKDLKEIQDKIKAEKEDVKTHTSLLQTNVELQTILESDQRKKLEEENQGMLQERLESLKLEVEQEKAELRLKVTQGETYKLEESVKLETELIELRAERNMMALQIEALSEEKKRLGSDIVDLQNRMRDELEIQQLQHFKVFRTYREAFESQKLTIEQRFHGLLEEAIQDAIFLATKNAELVDENRRLNEDIATMKDALSKTGTSFPLMTSVQQ